ncbi:hypothetical protein INT47_006368 [Mucor saturninus]|uniref:Uncharacterized protein n=1 Tax=Mucor saturninus TaxID=64648 RepID=A0A8H7RIM3_9FUNG|nr:hypothetical protein INT47_006368 [Mucor saturninus]
METKWETTFAQLTANMNCGFRNVPVTVSNHMYMISGEHCKCCSQLKKLQRANNKASINKPLVAASTENLQGQLRQAIAYYRDNNLIERIGVTMIVFGSRTIDAHTTGKTEDLECVNEAYLKEISSEYCSDEEIKARAKEAYNNVHSLCKHFVVAYFGDIRLTHFTWSPLEPKARREVVALFECIVLFWNKRVGVSGFPTAFVTEMISDAEASTPVMPLSRAYKSWMARRMLISAIQSVVPDKDYQVRQQISSGVSNNFDNLGLCEMPQIDTFSFSVSLSTLGSFGRDRMQDGDASNASSDRGIHDPQSEYRTSNFSLSDEVLNEVSDEVSGDESVEVSRVSGEVSGAMRQLADSYVGGGKRYSQRTRKA